MNYIVRTLTIVACFLAIGCSTNVSRFQMPDTDLATVRALHIDPPDDEQNAAELLSLITADLERRGYQVATKTDSTAFGDGEYIFDVATDWHWDLSWYLLELRVAIYDPADDTLIAQAQSQQSSLARKNNETVVNRVLASLFDDPSTDDKEQ